MYIGTNFPHAKREAQDRATRQGRPWYVYGPSSVGGYIIEPEYRPAPVNGTTGAYAGPPVFAARPQGWGGMEVCKCGHTGFQHDRGGPCKGGQSMCSCREFRSLKGASQ